MSFGRARRAHRSLPGYAPVRGLNAAHTTAGLPGYDMSLSRILSCLSAGPAWASCSGSALGHTCCRLTWVGGTARLVLPESVPIVRVVMCGMFGF